jgi:hypothetical protein
MKNFLKTTRTILTAIALMALPISANAEVISSAQTAIEANLGSSSPTSSAWFGSQDIFESYGAITAAQWNTTDGTQPGSKGSGILQWNLTGFTNPGDTIGTVSSASFTIMGKNSGDNTYKVYRLTDAISASTTWNTKPLLDTSASVSFTMAANYSLQTIDVSSLLANNGSRSTFGIAVLCDNYIGNGENFWSTAYNNWPAYSSVNKLSADYAVNAVPEPSSLALAGLGIAAAAWACRRRK